MSRWHPAGIIRDYHFGRRAIRLVILVEQVHNLPFWCNCTLLSVPPLEKISATLSSLGPHLRWLLLFCRVIIVLWVAGWSACRSLGQRKVRAPAIFVSLKRALGWRYCRYDTVGAVTEALNIYLEILFGRYNYASGAGTILDLTQVVESQCRFCMGGRPLLVSGWRWGWRVNIFRGIFVRLIVYFSVYLAFLILWKNNSRLPRCRCNNCPSLKLLIWSLQRDHFLIRFWSILSSCWYLVAGFKGRLSALNCVRYNIFLLAALLRSLEMRLCTNV